MSTLSETSTVAIAADEAPAGVERTPAGILPPDHPLAGVFSVGPDADAGLRRDAGEVLGVAIGTTVRCRFHPHEGKAATVTRLNPADREIGVEVRGSGRLLWCKATELAAARAIAPGERAA